MTRTSTDGPEGLLVIDKPQVWTSHDAVARVRKLGKTRKVGHAGTLDPMATGVLVLGLGRATRLLGHLALRDKDYDATIRLGATTFTDDAEGDIENVVDARHITDDEIARGVAALTGDLQQIPSKISAIKVDGQRAYKLVRGGQDVELAPRAVTVSRFDVLEVRRVDGFIDVDVAVTCSTGTYIRALARDLGADLAVGGHLTRLRRTRVGAFTDDEAVALSEDLDVRGVMLNLDDAVKRSFPIITLDADLSVFAIHGRPFDPPADVQLADGGAVVPFDADLGPFGVVGPTGNAISVVELRGLVMKPLVVFE